MIVVLLSFLAAFFAVLLIIKNIVFPDNKVFDDHAFRYLKHVVSPRNTSVMEFITIFGSHNFLVPAYLFLIFYFFFLKKDRWLGIKITAVSFSSLIVMFTLKEIFQRQRPDDPLLYHASGLSFPSGHAFMSFSFCGVILYLIYRMKQPVWIKICLMTLMLAFTFLIGLSRVYLRVHYASDVVAGFCMGFMWVVISLLVVRFMEKNKKKLPVVESVVVE